MKGYKNNTGYDNKVSYHVIIPVFLVIDQKVFKKYGITWNLSIESFYALALRFFYLKNE